MEVFILDHIFEIMVIAFIIVGIIIGTIETAMLPFDERYPDFLYSEKEREEIKRKGDYYDFAKAVKKGKRR